MKYHLLTLVLSVLAFATTGCGGGGEDKDADIEITPEQQPDTTDGDAQSDPQPDEVTQEEPGETPGEEQAEVPPEVEDDGVIDTPAEETTTATCGNGTPETGEACDDANQLTEFCGTGTACLGDCSLLPANCGNSAADTGEECDDGNADSTDSCTTSCTTNDHNIGAPCNCTGAGCGLTDFTAGTINGCDSVNAAGTNGEKACLYSGHESMSGTDTYFAEGYCTVMALKCEGGGLCALVPAIGNYDTFTCPAGYSLGQDSRTVMTTLTISTKMCFKICTSPSDCRWNAYDTFRTACGQYDCIPNPTDAGTSICVDARN